LLPGISGGNAHRQQLAGSGGRGEATRAHIEDLRRTVNFRLPRRFTRRFRTDRRSTRESAFPGAWLTQREVAGRCGGRRSRLLPGQLRAKKRFRFERNKGCVGGLAPVGWGTETARRGTDFGNADQALREDHSEEISCGTAVHFVTRSLLVGSHHRSQRQKSRFPAASRT